MTERLKNNTSEIRYNSLKLLDFQGYRIMLLTRRKKISQLLISSEQIEEACIEEFQGRKSVIH